MKPHFLGQTMIPPVDPKHQSVEKLNAGLPGYLPTVTNNSLAWLTATFKTWGHVRDSGNVMFPNLCDSLFPSEEYSVSCIGVTLGPPTIARQFGWILFIYLLISFLYF